MLAWEDLVSFLSFRVPEFEDALTVVASPSMLLIDEVDRPITFDRTRVISLEGPLLGLNTFSISQNKRFT